MAACHVPERHGPARRHPSERRLQERGPAGGDDEVVEDPARIQGCYWMEVPEEEPHGGLVVPFLLVHWMRRFDPWAEMDIPQGDRASVLRCKGIMERWGVEGVQEDPHELPYCLQPAQVNHIQYLQNGYFTARAGPPDFMWIDTMWDKLK